ncbi:hypothetical protein ACJJI3_03245 [Microbulbifer sp. ZKSA004]|uniref:hypothetical protein n=1 Tax=Microbulbifer sp. ZKSA004 TaxID=3243389 RepID=UPI0040396F5B
MAGVGQANSRAASTTSLNAVNGGAPATNEQDGNKSSFSKLLAGVKKSFFSAVNRFREKYGFHSRRTCNLPKNSYVEPVRSEDDLSSTKGKTEYIEHRKSGHVSTTISDLLKKQGADRMEIGKSIGTDS